MSGGDRGSGRTLARLATGLTRFYVGLGGPMLAVAVFLLGGSVWWALGSLLPWFLLAKMIRSVSR